MKDPYFPDFFALISVPLNTPLGPYIVLFSTFLLLWLLRKVLQSFTENNTATQKHPNKSIQQIVKPRKKYHSTTYLQQGFHITGLSPNNLEELRVLINKNDTLELALFFARYQPSIKEIDDAIDSIQNELSDMWDQIISTEIKSEKLAGYLRSKNHKSKNLNCLSENDFRNIIKHEQKDNKIIDQDFIARFGDFLFMENFIMYEHLCQSDTAVYYIPIGNELRRMFDMFVSSGIATNGLSIPLKERLKVLKLEDLQRFAVERNIEISIDSINDIIVALLKNEDTEYQFEIKYNRKDIFRLNKESWNAKAIEEEWTTYNVYAKLLSIQH